MVELPTGGNDVKSWAEDHLAKYVVHACTCTHVCSVVCVCVCACMRARLSVCVRPYMFGAMFMHPSTVINDFTLSSLKVYLYRCQRSGQQRAVKEIDIHPELDEKVTLTIR